MPSKCHSIRPMILQLSRKLSMVTVWLYQVRFNEEINDNSEETQLTRKAASSFSFQNRVPVTSYSAYELASLKPLQILSINDQYINAELHPCKQIELDAANEKDRKIITRLVNSDLKKGVISFAKNSKGTFTYETYLHQTSLVETKASERMVADTDYLSVNIAVSLSATILPCGTVLINVNLTQPITPDESLTLDDLLSDHPDWLKHIKKVRHTYRDKRGH